MDADKNVLPKTAEATSELASAVTAKVTETKEKAEEKASATAADVDAAVASKLTEIKDSEALKTKQEEEGGLVDIVSTKLSQIKDSFDKSVEGTAAEIGQMVSNAVEAVKEKVGGTGESTEAPKKE